jgi:hypothetical protein
MSESSDEDESSSRNRWLSLMYKLIYRKPESMAAPQVEIDGKQPNWRTHRDGRDSVDSGGRRRWPRRRHPRCPRGSNGWWGTLGGVWAVAAGSWKIGGDCGSGGPRAREGNELKCPSRQRSEGDIGWTLVPRVELKISGSARDFYRRP